MDLVTPAASENISMEMSLILSDLHIGPVPSDTPVPPLHLPPITELLSGLQKKLSGVVHEPLECRSLISRVEQLFQAADPTWLFFPSDQKAGAELRVAYGSVTRALIGCADLPTCEEGGGALSAAAYQDVPGRVTAVCSAVTALLKVLERCEGGAGLLMAVAPHICVFAVTHVQEESWTTPTSRAAARRLQQMLLKVGGWKDSAHLLTGDLQAEGGRRGILEAVLDVLQPKLSRESLWCHPDAVLLLAWTLLQVTTPFLRPHLHRFLPPSLLLNDHHMPERCMLGVRCLHHIVLNTPAADLLQFNRAQLLYQALFKHLYTTEPAVIQLVLSCLLDLLLVLEKPPSTPSSPRRRPRLHDDVLRLVLTNMTAEHKVALRRIYAATLPLFIDRMGVTVCRHMRRLEQVVLGYLQVGDPPEETSRLKILEALQSTIRVAWPRMHSRINTLLRCLLRLLVDVFSDSQLDHLIRQKLTDQTLACLCLLDNCSNGDVQRLLRNVDSGCCSPQVLGCLETVTMTTKR